MDSPARHWQLCKEHLDSLRGCNARMVRLRHVAAEFLHLNQLHYRILMVLEGSMRTACCVISIASLCRVHAVSMVAPVGC